MFDPQLAIIGQLQQLVDAAKEANNDNWGTYMSSFFLASTEPSLPEFDNLIRKLNETTSEASRQEQMNEWSDKGPSYHIALLFLILFLLRNHVDSVADAHLSQETQKQKRLLEEHITELQTQIQTLKMQVRDTDDVDVKLQELKKAVLAARAPLGRIAYPANMNIDAALRALEQIKV